MKLPATAWIAVVAIFASIVVAFLNKWWDPIAEHLGYPFGATRCLEELHAKVRTLSTMQSDLCYEDPSPSSAERRGWTGSVKDLVKKEQEMKDRLAKGRLSYLKMCKLGREAEMELKKASDLITQGGRLMPKAKKSHTRRSDRLLPDEEESPHPVQLTEQPVPNPLPGMEKTYYKVLNFIKDNRPESVIMGVWGMGGVGKTVLTNLVRDSGPLYHDYFLEVVLVQLGKGCTEVADLQKAIAIRMQLDQIDNEISQSEIIRRHLHNKNFLFLVDDLWKHLNLEDVGIHLFDVGPHRRKVVFTTRKRDVCTKMRCLPENTIQMKCLKKEEAWNLFTKYVRNTTINHAEIHELAKEIVEECSGLPMALRRIGEIMSSKKDPREWRTVIDLLKKSKLHEIPNCHEDLFKRLQESYDNLPAAMKERFLLCSLWPEKENISMKKLIRLWTGLGLLDGSSNASDAGYTFINYLVDASMLEKGDTGLDSRENSHVKVHNMTRMMAIGIVNEHGNKNKWLPNSSYRSALPEEMWCTVEKAWVSQEDTSRWCQWSSEARFPVLKMLLAQHVFSLQLISFFQNITFLDLEGVKRKEFPLVICKLAELQHLNLSATAFSFLDPLLVMLTKLKHLYIRNNMDLQEIPKGLILALKRLRGLDLFCTGASFPNVLEELARSDTDLDMLGFTVRTVGEITKLGQLKRLCTQALCMYQFEGMSDLDTVNLQFLAKLRELRELTIVHCFQREKVLVVEGGGPNYDQQLLPHLEIFELNNLFMLEKVTWKNAGINIRVVNIYRCDGLKDVTWVHHLKSLEQLTVAHCQEMERLIETGELQQGVDLNQTVAIIFPLLKKLELEVLPKLCMISHQACEFQELSYICVTRCNEMKGIHNQVYKQRINIHCSEDWWENSKSAGTSNPYLVPICS